MKRSNNKTWNVELSAKDQDQKSQMMSVTFIDCENK